MVAVNVSSLYAPTGMCQSWKQNGAEQVSVHMQDVEPHSWTSEHPSTCLLSMID